jgi:ATP-dependent DNA helicase RecQ
MDGFLKKEIKNYGSLIITEKGEGYIKDPETYLIPEDRDFDSSPKTDNNINKRSVIDQELMSSLIKLRKKVAQKFSVPPFVVFQEFSLEEMTYKYPINLEELKNINGVGEGKANKFGHDFISLIKGYVNENNIERPDDVKLRTSGAKSASKLSLIQNIDKKIPLDEIINSKGVEFSQLLFELESIVFSGTKLNIDYYINDILDEDQQLDLHDYFIGANNEDVSVALQEFDGEFDEDDIRLYRIKFISDIAN